MSPHTFRDGCGYMNKKKALLITNPCAGINRKRISPAEIIKKFPSADFDFTVEATKGPADATEIVKSKGNVEISVVSDAYDIYSDNDKLFVEKAMVTK